MSANSIGSCENVLNTGSPEPLLIAYVTISFSHVLAYIGL